MLRVFFPKLIQNSIAFLWANSKHVEKETIKAFLLMVASKIPRNNFSER